MYDSIDIEARRPAPKELTGPQLAWRAKKMTTWRVCQTQIRSALKPCDKFIWPDDQWPNNKYSGQEAEFVRVEDELVYFKIKGKIEKVGFKKFCEVLHKIKVSPGV